MNIISAQQWLELWERGANQHPLQQALMLLSAAYPDESVEKILELSIGERDRRLLLMHERYFGSRFNNTAMCPECNEKVEWQSNVGDLLVDVPENAKSGVVEFEFDHYRGRCRLPNSNDIARVMVSVQPERDLVASCIDKIEKDGVLQNIDQLPDRILEKVSETMEQSDPHAEINIQLQCPACSYQWQALFDIVTFIWAELNQWAEQMLHAVHRIAVNYGWSERDILNLSSARRQLYLGMLAP